MDLSVLVIAYHFPPSATVGGKRVARFCRYLPEFGIEPIVLTIDEASCLALDPSFRVFGQERLQIERVAPRTTFLEWYHRRAIRKAATDNGISSGRTSGEGCSPIGLTFRRHLLAMLQFPDANRGWYRPATEAAARLVDALSPDAVFSSGPPWTAHAVASTIARRRHLPWIADFRDAWTTDAWRKCGLYSVPRWRNWLDFRIEDRWLRQAALVVCATDQHRNALLHTHTLDKDRVATVTNGFDTDGIATSPESALLPPNRSGQPRSTKGAPRILLHAGELYAGRHIGTFCQAMALLAQLGRVPSKTVKAIFVGDTAPDIEREARASAPSMFADGMVVFQPRMTWEKVQHAVSQANVLLIIQGDHPTAIPAKFFEYLQTGKPILGIVQDGALKDMILRTGSGVVADPRDISAIASGIEQVLRMAPRPRQDVESVAKRFHFRNLTAELAVHIRRVSGCAGLSRVGGP